MAPPTVVLATTNSHKVAELGDLLAGLGAGLEVLARPDGLAEVDETGESFAANAELKAVAAALGTGRWALADDSGLEVDALDGAPGVRSARYAADLAAPGRPAIPSADGPDGGTHVDAANRRALLDRLGVLATPGQALPARARFRCALALADPAGVVRLRAEGVVEGTIVGEERGDGGFGYDPIFVPDEGDGRAFAQMSRTEKATISHRGRALVALADHLTGGAGAELVSEMVDTEPP